MNHENRKIQNMTSAKDNENDDRPPTPTNKDCCGNACNPCIFDIHKKLLEDWNKKKLNKLNIPLDKNYLSPIRYTRFIIDNVAKASEDYKDDNILFLSSSQHVMIKLGTITRPYTPISWTQKSMKLLVKLYLHGKASNYIKDLKVGDELFLRGPYGDFRYTRNSYKHILMLSIGSGVAAMYPLANSIVKDELEDTKISMILGFKSFIHVPLIDDLRLLSDFWNFECTLYLSQENNIINITGVNVTNCRLNEKIIQDTLDQFSSEFTLVLICGTPKFNENVEKIIREKDFLHCHVFR